MTDKEIAIKVKGVGKTFHAQSSSGTIKEAFISIGRKLTGRRKSTHHKGDYTALKDISFEVNKGDFFGIVGRNGSGKSTLLKILAGVYTPTKGSVQINGKLTPFIELGVGFNPELTGRDNVFLNGALLGFTRRQMEEMYDDIVDFAELHDFMETKLKNYSSGMQVRLAFSVAIRAESDILLIDEVLAVGDAAFQQKCFDYFELLKNNKKTVIIVSHDMVAIKRFCNAALLVKDGLVEQVGEPADIANEYSIMMNSVINESEIKREHNEKSAIVQGVKDIQTIVTDKKKIYGYSDTIKLRIEYRLLKPIKHYYGYSIIKDNVSVTENNSLNSIITGDKIPLQHSFTLDINLGNLLEGTYKINLAFFDLRTKELIGYKNSIATFIIKYDDKTKGGIVSTNCEWSLVR
jgi:ABC-2 type transport system ATP-binding protein